MSLIYPRKNGKPFLSSMSMLEHEWHIPLVELEAVAAKYRPTLEALGVLDGLFACEEVMLFVWLWKHDKEIEDAARGVGETSVRYEMGDGA